MKVAFSMLAIAGVLALATGSPAQTRFLYPDRTSSYDITFSNNNFSNANALYTVQESVVSTSGPATLSNYSVNLKSDHNGFGWTGYGGTSVSNINETSNFATADLSSDGSAGGYTFHYNTPAETDFNNLGGAFGNTWIVRRNFGGLIGLEFQGGGSGLVDANGVFTLDVLINGDWSHLGTGPFQTQYLGLDSHWTIDKYFTFNGSKTEFMAHANPYDNNNPSLDFILHGPAPAVPEPGIVTLLASLGLTGAAFLRRKRAR